MANLTKRIVIGRNVEIQENPTKEIISAVRRRREAAFAREAPELAAVARVEVPVYKGDDPRATPGALMASIESGLTKTGNLFLASGGAGARHAHLVEYGTVTMKANPFNRRAITKTRGRLLKTLKEELGRTPLV
jgi:HK97 gp10 family phage protein